MSKRLLLGFDIRAVKVLIQQLAPLLVLILYCVVTLDPPSSFLLCWRPKIYETSISKGRKGGKICNFCKHYEAFFFGVFQGVKLGTGI